MNKLIITLLSFGLYLTASAQCQADFTYSATNGTVSFTNTSTGGGIWSSWDFGDGNTSSQYSPTHTYTTSGNYLVCLTIFDSLSQCQSSFCDTLSVQVTNPPCNASFTYSQSNGTVNFTNTSSGSFFSSWTFGDGNTSNQTNPSNTYSSTGNYVVCLTIYDSLTQNQCTTCDTIFVQADTTGGGGNGCLTQSSAYMDSTGNITGNASGSAVMWHWIIYDAAWNFVYDTNNPNFTYQAGLPGPYNVCLTAYDSAQVVCDSICYTVGDTIAGITFPEEEIVFNVYPNPTQGVIHLEVSKDQIAEIVLVDITGAVLLQENITESTTDIDLSLYPKGMYFIHALGRKGQRLSTGKVLRQ